MPCYAFSIRAMHVEVYAGQAKRAFGEARYAAQAFFEYVRHAATDTAITLFR